MGAGEERIPERRRLALVAELLERISLQLPGSDVRRVGEHEVVHEFCDPPVVTVLERCSGFDEQSIRPAGERDVAFSDLGRWQFPDVGRVPVVPAEVSLVDRFDVVGDVPVVPGGV